MSLFFFYGSQIFYLFNMHVVFLMLRFVPDLYVFCNFVAIIDYVLCSRWSSLGLDDSSRRGFVGT